MADANFSNTIIEYLSGDISYDYSNVLYDAAARDQFLQEINLLIPRIPELGDTEIMYECRRIVSLLRDVHSGVNTGVRDFFPVFVEAIEEEQGISLCVVRVPEEYEHLIGSKLTAINGVSIEEVLTKLTPYAMHENEYGVIHAIVKLLKKESTQGMPLTQKPALEVIGVVDTQADSVELTFETEVGAVTEVMDFVSLKEYQAMETVDHDMITGASLRFQYDNNYGYSLVEHENGDFLYVRISKYIDESQYTKYQMFTEIANELRDAEEPLKLIIDFRYNSGGNLGSLTELYRFAQSVNKYGTNGTYILINGGCFSSGMYAPYALANAIDGALMVGTPTGQYGNSFHTPSTYRTPNFEVEFFIADLFFCGIPNTEGDAIYPDITVYQTWDDYQNNIDTVLEYILGLE